MQETPIKEAAPATPAAEPATVTFRPCPPKVVVLKSGRTLRVTDKDAGRHFIVQARGDDGSVVLRSRRLGDLVRVAGAEFDTCFKPWSMR